MKPPFVHVVFSQALLESEAKDEEEAGRLSRYIVPYGGKFNGNSGAEEDLKPHLFIAH